MKKDAMSFHIRFNNADPRHRKAARILNMVDRQKATIVANALWEYDEGNLNCEPTNKSPTTDITPQLPPKSMKTHLCNEDIGKQTPVHSYETRNNGLLNSIVATLGQFQE